MALISRWPKRREEDAPRRIAAASQTEAKGHGCSPWTEPPARRPCPSRKGISVTLLSTEPQGPGHLNSTQSKATLRRARHHATYATASQEVAKTCNFSSQGQRGHRLVAPKTIKQQTKELLQLSVSLQTPLRMSPCLVCPVTNL